MAARGRVNLPDLFSLMLAGLTINLNQPRREEFVHICVLAGSSKIVAAKSGHVLCKPREALNEGWDAM